MEKNRIRSVKTGKSMRMSYQRQEEVLEMPNLIEVQRDSYKWFLDEGLREVFDDISPIADYSGKLSLEFIDFTFDEKDAKYTIEQCKERDATYAAPLKVRVRLINKETEEINEHEIFMGDLPIMTVTGTFVINGAERVIVSQLVRSPGIYYAIAHDKLGKRLFSSTVIPNRGAWLEYETDSNDVFYVRVDRTRKVPITVLIRALGVGAMQRLLISSVKSQRSLQVLQRIHPPTIRKVFLNYTRKSVRVSRLQLRVRRALSMQCSLIREDMTLRKLDVINLTRSSTSTEESLVTDWLRMLLMLLQAKSWQKKELL